MIIVTFVRLFQRYIFAKLYYAHVWPAITPAKIIYNYTGCQLRLYCIKKQYFIRRQAVW